MLITPVNQPSASPMEMVNETSWDNFTIDATAPINVTDHSDVTSQDRGLVVAIYSVMQVFGTVGNVAVFTSLVRSRRRKSRVDLLMTHLTIADLIVVLFVIPLEIIWGSTNAWLAGNLACKILMAVRAFGLYLSSNVLVCISVDRFYAVIYPLRIPIARKRSKTMLFFSWIIAFLCSIPQSLVFKVMTHPKNADFQQCVTFGTFTEQQQIAYNALFLCLVFFLPLLIITVCYTCIFYEISRNSNEMAGRCCQSDGSRIYLRRSDERPLARARRRTLWMTVTIVTVFACCWLPYATMVLWYMLDRHSAELVSKRVQDILFMMAVSNSCMDPFVYGSYTLDLKTIFNRTIRKILCMHTTYAVDLPVISAPGTLKSKVPLNTEGVHTKNIKSSSKGEISACLYEDPQHIVRFEETSFCSRNTYSDPYPKLSAIEYDLHSLRPSRSCEVFSIHHKALTNNDDSGTMFEFMRKSFPGDQMCSDACQSHKKPHIH